MEIINKREFNVTGLLRTRRVGGIVEHDWDALRAALALAVCVAEVGYYYYKIHGDSLQLAGGMEGDADRVALPFTSAKSVCNFVEQWVREHVPYTDAAGERFGYRIHLSGAPSEICTVSLVRAHRGK